MADDLPDKNYLYGVFQNAEDWRNRLHRKLAHKSLDIADGEEVNVDNSRTGIGWKELAVIAATGLAGFGLYSYNQQTSPPVNPPSSGSPIDSEYEVRFYDADGKPIKVERLPDGTN